MTCVVTIGNFDGVHLGHRAILTRARALAAEAGVPVRVLAFDPAPLSVLRPGSQPLRLIGPQQKVELLKAAGADEVVLMKPTPELLAQTPGEFVAWLVREHQPRVVVEGPDFGFGKGRRGNVDVLRVLGVVAGFGVEVVHPVAAGLSDQLLAPVHSALVRWLLAHGRVADAARCLGRRFSLSATVIKGEQRGRELGVPTANLDPAALDGWAVPADGVYCGTAVLPDGTTRAAAISIGTKPTFGVHGRLVEAHLLDFDADLYGRVVTLQFQRGLRDQQPFPALAALRAQLQRDIAQTRRWDILDLPDGRREATAASTF